MPKIYRSTISLMGKVEVYLVDIFDHIRSTFKAIIKKLIQEVETKQQREWTESKAS